jgi:hypothetical protein
MWGGLGSFTHRLPLHGSAMVAQESTAGVLHMEAG